MSIEWPSGILKKKSISNQPIDRTVLSLAGNPSVLCNSFIRIESAARRSRIHSRKADRERERKKAKKKVCLRIYLFSLYLERAGWIELQSDFEITDGGPRGRVGGADVSQRRGCHYCCGRLSREGRKKKKVSALSDSRCSDASHVLFPSAEVRAANRV